MKRKSSEVQGPKSGILKLAKKQKAKASQPVDVDACFRKGLFDDAVLEQYTNGYAKSEPYKHAVIHELMNDALLRSVRDEVRENVQFTPKETDIYKIHQSGDLANLDGLDDAALERLPSLLKLRDALYSPQFRKYAATITGSGALSGKKTDMAINVYTPGCHLLCHDDVIGSRRISYILYLPDPDIPWKEEWGGALRLYPTTRIESENGDVMTVPSPDVSKVIPPAWNQLSFFAVQPGLSFHDVEEVYHADTKEQQEKEGGRVRMAISGWFHIPQKGEEGYVEGAEEKLAEKSSLVQLQGKADEYDFPKENVVEVSEAEKESEEGLEEADIDFLLKYMAPTYLTPDTMEQVTEHFEDNSAVTIDNLLSKKFSARLRDFVEKAEASPLPATGAEIEQTSDWRVAKPPHKHRFLYLSPSSSLATSSSSTSDGKKAGPKKQKSKQEKEKKELTPIQELIDVFLPSREFRKWLKLATNCTVASYDILARRFRKGSDYALATSHDGEPRLEVCLGFTPTTGWGDDDIAEDDDEEQEQEQEPEQEAPQPKSKKAKAAAAKAAALAKAVAAAKRAEAKAAAADDDDDDDVGGHEVYMAGDDDEDDADAAVYKTSSSGGDDDDDNVLFTVPATWNKMSIVLRDSGVLRFVKYVSRKARGDRWDVSAVFGVTDEDEDEDDEEEGVQGGAGSGDEGGTGSEDETFNGFPDSDVDSSE